MNKVSLKLTKCDLKRINLKKMLIHFIMLIELFKYAVFKYKIKEDRP